MARVNILRRVKTSKGWANVALKRNTKRRIQWPSGGPFLIEWRENGSRLREAAGTTPAEALEAQKRKRLELEARSSGLSVHDPEREAEGDALPLEATIHAFLQDVRTFRKPMTYQKYQYVLELSPSTSHPSPTPGLSLPRTLRSSLPGESPRASTLALRFIRIG